MENNKIILPIKGMHCKSCEILLEQKIREIEGVSSLTADHKKGHLEIYSNKKLPENLLERKVKEAGYEIGQDSMPMFSNKVKDYQELGIVLVFALALFFVLKSFGLMNLDLAGNTQPTGYFTVLAIGLTAGISTCMALVGGLVLGLSAGYAEKHPKATSFQKFQPHLFFHLGRVSGFFVLGGVLGTAGSIFQFSSMTLAVITIAVGIIMLLIGFQLIDIFPRLKNFNLTMPRRISGFLGYKPKEYSHRSALIGGAATFFLPCGFTQAMQILAVSTGSFLAGALVMSIFALGTLPALLGIGAITSIVKGSLAKKFYKFAGVVVIFFALFNITNAMGLAGINVFNKTAESKLANNLNERGQQVVNMEERGNGYYPNSFTIKKGVPVRWVIDAKAPNSCASALVVPKLDLRKFLKAGENIIEFTPTETGKINFSCSMGMYTGVFNVVEEGDAALNIPPANTDTASANASPITCDLSPVTGGSVSCQGSVGTGNDTVNSGSCGGGSGCRCGGGQGKTNTETGGCGCVAK
jgi:uncharacterized protein